MNSVNDGLPFGLTGKKRVSIYTEARIAQEVFLRSTSGDTACAVCTTEKRDSKKELGSTVLDTHPCVNLGQ